MELCHGVLIVAAFCQVSLTNMDAHFDKLDHLCIGRFSG